MSDLNPEVFEDLQVAEKSRPLFEAAGLPLRTWEAYALAFNERNLLRREIHRISDGRGSPDIHPEVLERLKALRSELDPMVGQLRKFLPPEPANPEDRERLEMVLGFIAVSPTAREVAIKWIADPERHRQEALAKLQLIEHVVERYRRALRAEIDAQMTQSSLPPSDGIPQPGAVTRIMKRPASEPAAEGAEAKPAAPQPLTAPASFEGSASSGEVSLIWSAVPGASQYIVKRGSSRGGPYSVIARPTQDCYADTDLQNGATYYYVVVAVGSTGSESPPSAEVASTPLAPPQTPPQLRATAGNARVQLSWSPSAGAARYKLVRSTTPSGPFAIVVSTPDTSFNDTSVANGTTYFYAVAAQNSAGESALSLQIQAMPVAPPPPPVGLVAAPGNSQITLTWTAVHGATSYTVRRSRDAAGPFATVAGPGGPTWVDKGAANDNTYHYNVTALNAGGESAPSATVSAAPTGPPSPPTGLATSATNGEIALTWNPVAGASSYTVRRASSVEGPWTVIANPAGPAYTDTGLPNGVTVFYAVASQNVGGESAGCTPIASAPIAPPAAPVDLAASPGNTRVTLSWPPAPDATSYLLKRSSAPGGPYESIATPEGTSHTDLLLSNNVTYYYTLCARNAGGLSAASLEVAATPVGAPGAAGEIEAVPGNGQVALRWRTVPTAERYRVMRSTNSSGPYTAIANPETPEYIDTSAENAVTYYYVIRAMNEGGKGPFSAEVSATPIGPPPIPTELVVTPSNGSVALSWAPVKDANSYTVYRALAAEGPFSALATPGTPSAIDAEVTNGTPYFYAVTSRNAGGESARSGVVSGVPLAPPGAPSALAATPGNGIVSLRWGASPRTESYSVRRGTSSSGPFDQVATTQATSYADSTVTNGTVYYYVVASQNPGGGSAPSAMVAATPVAPPPAPSGLQLSSGSSQVALTWSPAPRATSYSVRRATEAGGPFTAIGSPGVPSHIDTDVKNGVTYRYQIVALNAGGESPPSSEITASPTAPPAPITALEATSGNGQVSLHWPAAEGASSYVIKRSLAADGTFAPIATVPACTFVDAGLTNGTPYHYRVNAINGSGSGLDSGTATATPVAPPTAPTGLSSSAGNREVELKWAPSTRAVSYLVKRSDVPGGPFQDIATAVGPGHQDSGLENGKNYYYVITAVNTGGESAPSAEIQGTPIEPPATPGNVTATAGNNQVLVAWSASSGATYYRIKRANDRRGPYVTVANVSRLNHVDNGVENGKTYYYVVHALNAGGKSAHSVRVSATPVFPPPPPSSVIALAGNFRVSITWEAVSGATGYSIKRATSPNGPFVTIARVPQTSYLDAAVSNGTTYYYMVRSATGVIKGPLSAQVRATPTAPPAAPAGLAATPGHGVISLVWNGSPGATCYHVKRSDAADGPFETVASPESASWEDVGLSNGLHYHYRVSAENAGGESPDSLPVVASPVAPPAVPTSLQATPSSGEVTLVWTPVAESVGYRVKRAASLTGPFDPIAEPAEAAYTDTGLTNGATYHYVVSALNAHGESLDSFPAQATPVGAPATPVGLTAMSGSGKIEISWRTVPFAVRYRVMRSATPGGPYVLIASPRDASYTDAPLTNGIPQYYVLVAVNAGGESAASVEVSAAPGILPGEKVPAPAPAQSPARKSEEAVPTLESIPMPAGKQIQGIDLERLLDLRRVEQLRALFEDTAQKFEEWEVLILIAEEGYETRKTMELLLRLKNQGNQEGFTSGAVALFEKILKIRAQHAAFVRKLRAYLEQLEAKVPSRAVLEIALGFILQASRGRLRAENWVEDPDFHRKGAAEYMKMAYTIAEKYKAAL